MFTLLENPFNPPLMALVADSMSYLLNASIALLPPSVVKNHPIVISEPIFGSLPNSGFSTILYSPKPFGTKKFSYICL